MGEVDSGTDQLIPNSKANQMQAHRPLTVTESLIKGSSGAIADQQYFSTGFSHRVFKYLQQTLHFNFSFIVSSGSVEAPVDGVWTGSGALLINGTADLSIDLSILVPFRAERFVPLHPIFLDKASVFFRQPPASSVRDIYTDPFTTGVWLTLIGFLLLAWILLFFLTRCLADNGDQNLSTCKYIEYCRRVQEEVNGGQEAGSGILWLLSLLKWPYRTDSLRFAFFVGSVAGLVLNTLYTMNSVSLFTLDRKPIDNLPQFLSSSIPIYVSKSTDTIRAIFEGTLHAPSNPLLFRRITYVESTRRAFDLAVDRKAQYPSALLTFPYRFYTETDRFYPNTQKNPFFDPLDYFYCKFTEMEAMSGAFRMGWLLSQQSSGLREEMNVRIVGLYTSGLLWRDRKWYVDSYRPPCAWSPKEQVLAGLTVADTFTAYFAFLVGVGLALVVVISEKLSCG